jgi:vacuolar-type H+-ATPase subunit B/Vma2
MSEKNDRSRLEKKEKEKGKTKEGHGCWMIKSYRTIYNYT